MTSHFFISCAAYALILITTFYSTHFQKDFDPIFYMDMSSYHYIKFSQAKEIENLALCLIVSLWDPSTDKARKLKILMIRFSSFWKWKGEKWLKWNFPLKKINSDCSAPFKFSLRRVERVGVSLKNIINYDLICEIWNQTPTHLNSSA